MNLKNTFLLILLIGCINTSFSQNFNENYFPIKSLGLIPDDFTYSTKKKVQDDLTLIKKDTSFNDGYGFTIQTNYAIDKQLHGGNILLNDEISVYVNKIADELLKNDKNLRDQIKIYVTKVPETNAYCMGKGYIFINLGLIAQVTNEAQLAYILSHEISHFVKKHNLKTFIEFKKIEQENYKKKTFDDRDIKMFKFSKENEIEADMEGYKMYKKSDYDLSCIKTVFDVLQYSYLPFDEVEFDISFFNDGDYIIPSKYFLKKTQDIKIKEDYDDTKSTHPNIKKRKEKIDSLLQTIEDVPKKKFIVSEQSFYKVRDICRFEECRIFLIERNYMDAIVSAYILQKKYPNNLYLHKIIAKSLYAITFYKNGNLRYDYNSYNKQPIPDYTKTEGFSQQLNFFLDKLPPQEMAILTLNYIWKSHQNFPNEPTFIKYSDTLFTILNNKFHLGTNDFYSKSKQETNNNKQTISSSDDYYKYSFVNFLKNDSEFNNIFKKVLSESYSNNSEPIGFKVYSSEKEPSQKKEDKKEKVVDSLKLKINKIIIVDPFYYKYDETEPETSMYMVSDKKEDEFINTLKNNFTKNKMNFEVINPGEFKSTEIQKYNEYSILQDWYNERMDGGEKQNIPVLNSDEINDLISQCDTKYFLWTGVLNIHFKNKPGLVNMLKYIQGTAYYCIVFNIETGQMIQKDFKIVDKSDTPGLINKYVDTTLRELMEK